jgi:RNA polymerase sigma-70 factor, ECF subfamily
LSDACSARIAKLLARPPESSELVSSTSQESELTHANSTLSNTWPSGDQHPIAWLYRTHSRTVYSVAFRVLHDPSAAEDVLQDVFLKIWSAPVDSIELNRSPKKWLGAVSRNRAIDMLRRQHLSDSIEEFPHPFSEDALEAVERKLLVKRMKLLIRELPVLQREALEMAFFRGMSHIEIANRLQTPLGTIKTRIRAALRTLGISIRR